MNRNLNHFLLTFFCLMATHSLFAQISADINSVLKPLDSIAKALPREKLFLHLDKPNYAVGDTIWFKAYLLDAGTLAPSSRSGLLYIELDDATENNVKRMMVPLSSGVSWGNMTLIAKDVPSGKYTMRAYTNWMRNFGQEAMFQQQIYVSSADNGLLVSAKVTVTKQGVKDSIQALLAFKGPDSKPVRMTDMQLTLMDGAKTLRKYKGSTDVEGNVKLSFALADNNKRTFIKAKLSGQKQDDLDLVIPVSANRPENIDLQFMPEGGSLVSGLPAHIAFKAVGEDGHAANVSGRIFNNKKEEQVAFTSLHKGMGAFDMLPVAGDSYYAEIDLPGGGKKTYQLPQAKASGTSMMITPLGKDSLLVTLGISPDLLIKLPVSYYLIAQAQGQIPFTAQINFQRPIARIAIPKVQLLGGIVRFTLMTTARQPVNERSVFVAEKDHIAISIAPDRTAYGRRDSVNLAVRVVGREGKPLSGNFSVSVTDDSQVKKDSLANNLLSTMLLTADLKGDIEDPAYYLTANDSTAAAAIDNLLLTQGWVGYNWEQVYAQPKAPVFAAEKEFTLSGKSVNLFGKPLVGGKMVLFGKKPVTFLDTVTNDQGRFVFEGLSPVDTPAYAIQARNKKGRAFGVGIELNEFKAPVFTPSDLVTTPWYVNTDTATLRNLNAIRVKQAAEDNLIPGGNLLRNVNIKAKKIIPESKNLNGSGEADLVLDEADMQKAGSMTLQQLLEQKLKGFREYGMWDRDPSKPAVREYYVLDRKRIHFIFDGVDVNFLYNGDYIGPPTGMERWSFLKDYLQYYTAHDIKGIEVISSGKYNGPYSGAFLDMAGAGGGPGDFALAYAFIEITTYGGQGPFLRKNSGLAVYRPMPLSMPKDFYRPKYTIKSATSIPDSRATVHWEPNLVTNEQGIGSLSFFTTDRPGKYSVIIQGTDLNGQLGYQRSFITVK